MKPDTAKRVADLGEVAALLDALEDATLTEFKINGTPDSWDEEEQRDIDAAKLEATERKRLIRVRILHTVLYPRAK